MRLEVVCVFGADFVRSMTLWKKSRADDILDGMFLSPPKLSQFAPACYVSVWHFREGMPSFVRSEIDAISS